MIYIYMALSENSVPSKACCIRGYDSRYVSEVCFGGNVSGYVSPSLVLYMGMIRGMIRGYDSGA